jgi:hypothetical protein
MRKAAAIALLGFLTTLVQVPEGVRAGTLPDITGTWYASGDTSKRCEISQSGTSVKLRNEQGRTATGTFSDPSTLTTDWGYFGGHSIRGSISPNLRRIDWSNGTYWSRESSPQPTATPNPYRTLRFAAESLAPPGGPIVVLDGWGAAKRDGKSVVVCVSFKNTRSVAATRIVFDFPLTNRNGDTVETLHLDRRGTFSSGIDIRGWSNLEAWQSAVGHRGFADNCVIRQAGIAALSLLNAHFIGYRVEHVEFADGSVWPER